MFTTLLTSLLAMQGSSFGIAWNQSAPGYWNLSSDGNNVYALSKKGQLRVYSGRDGSLLYDKKFSNEASAIKTLPDGSCYIVAESKLSKLDRNLGKLWTSTQTVQYTQLGSGIAVNSTGTIAVNTLRGLQLFKNDGSSDGLTSMFGAGVGCSDPIFLSDDTVVFLGGGLSALTTERKKVWTSKTGQGIGPLLFNNSLYVSSNETIAKACVIRLNASDGKLLWSTPTTTVNSLPAVSQDAVVVPGDLGMWGLAPSDGHVGWRNGLHTFSKALVIGKNLAVVMSRQGSGTYLYLSLVDMLTGKVLASEQVVQGVTSRFEPPFVKVGEHAVAGYYMDHIFLARLDQL